MYILLIAIVVLWLYSLYTFAKWRYYNCLYKGVVLETVLHDRLTKLYLRCTTGITKRFHWPFKDPEELTGTHEEKLEALRGIRYQIREKVNDWFKTLS